MPLPDNGNNTPWPPASYADAFDKFGEWGAWYSGDPNALARVYERIGQRVVNHPHVRPSQYRGGLVGAMARFFWGQPIPTGEKRVKLHVPLAGEIASKSADLLFSEPLAVTSDDKPTQAKLDELMNDQLHTQLLEAADVAAGLGGVYLRTVWDREVNPDGPWVSAVHADAAIPKWTYGRLRAATFWRVLADDGRTVVRHLERHEPGAIFHAVYEGTQDVLGRRVPLDGYDDTKMLDDVVETDIKQLTAAYMPNMRPNRIWRNSPECCHLGRSDYAGAEPFLDTLDEIYTSWLRDIRLAKGRAFVPEMYLQDRGPGRGAYFDPDREIYETLNMLPSADGGQQITVSQFEIRVDEHERSAKAWVEKIISSAGYSGQSFGLAGEVAITATEVGARERQSLVTRGKKIKYCRPPLRDSLEAVLAIGQVRFGWKVTPAKPMIEWPDAVEEDQASLAQTLQLLDAAKSVSIETKVRMLHPDWEDPQVKAEVKRIKDETGAAPLQDPGTFRGDAGDEPPEDGPEGPAGEE